MNDHDLYCQNMIWRQLRDAGGWWSEAEVYAHWCPAFELREVRRHLQGLHKATALERRICLEQPGRHVYGVTAKCTPPAGQSLTPGESLPC